MRLVFGALALLVVLAIVSLQARNQIKTLNAPTEQVPAPGGSAPTANPKLIEQQYKKAIEDAMNTPRPRSTEE